MIKWGVIGTADIAKGCTIPGMKNAYNCDMYAIAGRNIDKANQFKDEYGFKVAYGSYDELLADNEIEAVYIALPNDLHYEWCMKAFKAGKHVLCEKPLAPSKKETEELFAAAKEAGVILTEAFAYLHTPYVAALKEDVNSGIIGDIKYIESAFMVQSMAETNFRNFRENYGGAMYDLGCYSISLFTYLFDMLPVRAEGMAEFTKENIDVFSSAYFIYENGIRASLNCGMIFGNERFSRMDRLYIHGTKGCIKSDTEYNQQGDLSYRIIIDGKETVKTISVKHNYQLEVERLGECITDGKKPLVTPEFSIMNAEVIDIALKAIGYN